MREFHNLLRRVVSKGDVVNDPRTKVSTIGISGHQYTVDLRKRFPIHTTKRIYPKFGTEELMWKLRGEDSIGTDSSEKSLVQRGVHYWNQNAFQKYLDDNGLAEKIPKHTQEWEDEFASYEMRLKNGDEKGFLGPVYGYNWRHGRDRDGKEVDQLANLLRNLKDPVRRYGRYNILDAWDAPNISHMALGPCPFWHQFIVKGEFLDLHAAQRSCDSYLGIAYNDLTDAILAQMVAAEVGLTPRFYTHTFMDTHVYTGVPPRSDFWDDRRAVEEFKGRFENVRDKDGFLQVRDWYLGEVSPESEIDLGKDHMPHVLTQLSYEPKQPSARLVLKDLPLMEAIQAPSYRDVLSVRGYKPHEWEESPKAKMAA